MKIQTFNLRLDNRTDTIKKIGKLQKGFVEATIYTREHLCDVTTTSFDYLWSYCLGYYNFFVMITTED